MATLRLMIVLITIFVMEVQHVYSNDLEHYGVGKNNSEDIDKITQDEVNTTQAVSQARCVEIIGLIFQPMFAAGMFFSVIACLAAFVVYAWIRKKVFQSSTILDQDNTKHWVHFNFIISFILRDVATLIALFGFRPNDSLIASTFYIYTLIANFYWMFVEGLWLYVGVFFANSYRRWHKTKLIACLIGWMIPAIFMTIWAVSEYILLQRDVNIKTWMNKNGFWGPTSVACILAPVYLILIINSIMMIRVLYKLGTMMRGELKMKRRLARATFVMSFLLGLNFAIPLIIFSLHLPAILNNMCATQSIIIINSVISSLQGFFVAIFYVLSNRDVLQFFRTQVQEDLSKIPTPLPSPRLSRISRISQTSQASRISRTSQASRISQSSRASRISQLSQDSGKNCSSPPSSAKQSRQTSTTSSTLQVPSIRSYHSSLDSQTSQGSSLVNVPSCQFSRVSETSETSETLITLYVPTTPMRSNSDGYNFMSRNGDSVFV